MVTDTHQLIDAVKQYYPVAQFFKDRYFPDGKPFFSEEVWIDSKKQGRKIAPFVIPKINGITIESEGIRTDRIKAPTIALKMPITPEDLEKRAFGEDPNSNRAPADREREVEADHIDEMRNSILRRHEKMCTDIITTGEIEIKQYANANDAAADVNAQVRVLKYYETAFDNRYKQRCSAIPSSLITTTNAVQISELSTRPHCRTESLATEQSMSTEYYSPYSHMMSITSQQMEPKQHFFRRTP